METIILQAGYSTASIIFVLIICLLVFLAIREIMTWYWKIDRIIKNQETQIGIQEAMLEELRKKVYRAGAEVKLD